MPLIILFGPDGAGKTTIAIELIKKLKELNYQAIYIKMKSHHLLIYVVLKLLQKMNKIPNTHTPRLIDYSLRAIFRDSNMYIFLEMLNILVWYFIFVLLHLKRGKTIVADRFAPDSVVSLHCVSNRVNNVLERILLRLCKDSIAVYVYAQPWTLLQRKRDENLSEVYLKYITRLYNKVAGQVASIARNLVIIDTTSLPKQRSVDLIFSSIKKHI
jgi:thymidylate kinase